MSKLLTEKETKQLRLNFVDKLREPMRSEFRRVVDTIDALRAQVARLEAANAALTAAGEVLARSQDWILAGFPCKEDYKKADEAIKAWIALQAALSDTGERWLPPEVREQAGRAILYLAGIIHRQRHTGQFFTRCETVPCLEARAALDALEVK